MRPWNPHRAGGSLPPCHPPLADGYDRPAGRTKQASKQAHLCAARVDLLAPVHQALPALFGAHRILSNHRLLTLQAGGRGVGSRGWARWDGLQVIAFMGARKGLQGARGGSKGAGQVGAATGRRSMLLCKRRLRKPPTLQQGSRGRTAGSSRQQQQAAAPTRAKLVSTGCCRPSTTRNQGGDPPLLRQSSAAGAPRSRPCPPCCPAAGEEVAGRRVSLLSRVCRPNCVETAPPSPPHHKTPTRPPTMTSW